MVQSRHAPLAVTTSVPGARKGPNNTYKAGLVGHLCDTARDRKVHLVQYLQGRAVATPAARASESVSSCMTIVTKEGITGSSCDA